MAKKSRTARVKRHVKRNKKKYIAGASGLALAGAAATPFGRRMGRRARLKVGSTRLGQRFDKWNVARKQRKSMFGWMKKKK